MGMIPTYWVACKCYVHPVVAWARVHSCGRCKNSCTALGGAQTRADAERQFTQLNGHPLTPL